MKNINENIRGLLIQQKSRKAGSMIAEDGKTIEWKEAEQLFLLPLGNAKGEIVKYTIAPERIDHAVSIVANLYWGTLVELVMEDKLIVDVKILCDWLADLATDDLM